MNQRSHLIVATMSVALFLLAPETAQAQGIGAGDHRAVEALAYTTLGWFVWVAVQAVLPVVLFVAYDRFRSPLEGKLAASIGSVLLAVASNLLFSAITVSVFFENEDATLWAWGVALVATTVVQVFYTVVAIHGMRPN